MKIVLCCKVYPTSRAGGMAFVCQDRARALVKMGHEVHVLTTGRKSHHGETLQDEGVEIHHLPCKPSHYSREFAEHSERHCKAFLPEILHSDSFSVDYPWQVEFGNAGKGTLTATTLHGCCWGAYFTELNLWFRHGGNPPSMNPSGIERERRIMLGFNQVIGISIHEHWILNQLLGISTAKLVYNPLPDYFFKDPNPNLPNGRRRFLCAAVSQHRKRGFEIAERAAKRANVDLVVVENRPRTEMPRLLDRCHGLILPTAFAQGLDLTVGEAIVRRRPVFATATGSYLREASLGGVYEGAIKLIPLSGEGLDTLLTDHLDWTRGFRFVRDHLHGADIHATNWLTAILNQDDW